LRVPEEVPSRSPLDHKDLARARFNAEQATTEELAREVAAVTREMALARLQEFLAGSGTLDSFLETIARAAMANLAFSKTEAETARAQALHWMFAWNAEVINRGRFEAGKLSRADYAQTRWARLEAEQAWKDKGRLGGLFAPLMPVLDDVLNDVVHGVPVFKELAKARFEAARTPPGEVALARQEAAREALTERMKEFLDGRGSLIILLKACQQAGDAERALSKDQTALAKSWASEWSYLMLMELVNRARYEAGKITAADFFETRYERLDAERRWPDKSRLTGVLSHPAGVREDEVSGMRDLAKARFAAARRPELVAGDQLESVQEMMHDRLQEFISGRGTLDLFLDCSRYLLTVELALSRDKADRLKALQRHWGQMYEAEKVNQGRYEAGKINIADFLDTKRARLEAEIALQRERKLAEKK
jgi:hypothetical protein